MPHLWIVAGPNGAGKSTLVRRYNWKDLPIVNPDEIVAETPGVSPVEAGRRALREQARLLAEGKSFIVETTLSGRHEMALFERARAAGFKVNFVYVGIANASMATTRVRQRIARGGHAVPPPDVRRRFMRSMSNLPSALDLSDRAYVFDNTGKRRRLVLVRQREKTKYVSASRPPWARAAIPKRFFPGVSLDI